MLKYLHYSVGVLFTGEPQDQGATVRDTIQFTCGVTGSNPISFEWFKNGNLLADNTHFSGTTTASLRIMSVASDDYGRYSCRASNPVNSVRSRGALLTGDCVCVCVCVCVWVWV